MFSRIFKKITLFDYLLVFIFVFLVLFAFLNFSRERKAVYLYTLTDYQQYWDNVYPSFYWVANSINKGDKAFSSTGSQIAEVVEVDNVDWGMSRRYIRLKLKAYPLFDKRTKQYRIGNRPLSVGNTITLDINNTNYEGMIVYVGEESDPEDFKYRYISLNLKVYRIEPSLAESYKRFSIVRNTEGQLIFRVDKADVFSTEESVPTSDGRIKRALDPYYKDVYISATVRVRCHEGVCYFNEVIPVKVGGVFKVESQGSIISDDNTYITKVNGFINDINDSFMGK